MLLDRLLQYASVSVAPFAVCDIRRGARLELKGEQQTSVHFVLSGQGDLIVRGERRRVGRYTLVLVPPGIPHAVAASRQEMPAVELAPEGIQGVERIVAGEGDCGLFMACGALRVELRAVGLFERLEEPVVEAFDDTPRMKVLFDALLEEQLDAQPGRTRLIESIMMQCVVYLLRRLSKKPSSLVWLQALDDPQMRRALDAILERPEAAHTVDGLAQTAGMSRSSFGARFVGAFGTSPMAFVKEVRLQAGAHLLRSTDLPIKAIAAKVGYASRSHFSRAFKEQYARDPATYRGDV